MTRDDVTPTSPRPVARLFAELLAELRAELTMFVRGTFEDGTPVSPEMQAEAAMLLSGLNSHVQAMVPVCIQTLLHVVHHDKLPDIRAMARQSLLETGLLTAKEVDTLSPEAAHQVFMQRLIASGWTDPTSVAG